MERAQPAIQPPLALELDIAAHQVHDVGAAVEFFNVFVWDHLVFCCSFYRTCHLRGTNTSSNVRMANSSLMPLM